MADEIIEAFKAGVAEIQRLRETNAALLAACEAVLASYQASETWKEFADCMNDGPMSLVVKAVRKAKGA